jgi:hypothetical protein
MVSLNMKGMEQLGTCRTNSADYFTWTNTMSLFTAHAPISPVFSPTHVTFTLIQISLAIIRCVPDALPPNAYQGSVAWL